MELTLKKLGDCRGCMFFDGTYQAEQCKTCERNPQIAASLRDNMVKSGTPKIGPQPDSPFIEQLEKANDRELGQYGIRPRAARRREAGSGPPT